MKDKTPPKITIKRHLVNKQDSIQLFFKYNDQLLTMIRTIGKFRWSKTLSCWHGPFSQENLKTIKKTFADISTIIEDESIYNTPIQKEYKKKRNLSNEQNEVLNTFIKYLKGKRYSKSTVNTYSSFIAEFLNYIKNKSVTDLTNRDVEKFIEDVFIPRRYSISTQRQFISAMKLFADFNPGCDIKQVDLKRPKKSKYLPTVLSQPEILEILRCTKNLKHRAILALIYSCGIRVGELINLELLHIDIIRKQLAIRNSKGRKDRYVNIAESIIPLLRNYILTFKPIKYFAEGKPKNKYSANSVRAFLKKSTKLANITKHVTPHTLRHSYATHLLESGTDIRLIQTLLGHNKPETTMIYTHVSRSSLEAINNPLDVAVKKYLTHNGNQNNPMIGPIIEE